MKILKRLFTSNQNKSNTKISTYKLVDSFWRNIITDRNWYLNYSPQQFDEPKYYQKELAPLIAKETNMLRYRHIFKQEDYFKIMQWDNIVYDADEQNLLLQFCSNCKTEIDFMVRYPKSICEDCKKQLTNSEGRKVEFFNTNILGTGCQGYYVGTNQQEKYDSTICFIEDKTFEAEEGRFGGIIVQLKDKFSDIEPV